MHCAELVAQLLGRLPAESPADVLRWALLLVNSCEPEELDDPHQLDRRLSALRLQYRSASDQLAAVAHDLRATSAFEPNRFDPQQIWTLVRAVKVHSQLLSFYLTPAVADSTRRATGVR